MYTQTGIHEVVRLGSLCSLNAVIDKPPSGQGLPEAPGGGSREGLVGERGTGKGGTGRASRAASCRLQALGLSVNLPPLVHPSASETVYGAW